MAQSRQCSGSHLYTALELTISVRLEGKLQASLSQGTVVATLYIGIAMVFVFSQYIRKFSSYFHFQVILTFNDFIALNV